jgi:hypothetical protein
MAAHVHAAEINQANIQALDVVARNNAKGFLSDCMAPALEDV